MDKEKAIRTYAEAIERADLIRRIMTAAFYRMSIEQLRGVVAAIDERRERVTCHERR